jgi:exopolyphosphatase/guanosine-5'-triphosphate,3'-diphosphate pyrophosphatase
MKHAVIDIGTNTCLLIIAETENIGTMNVIADIHAIARLGAGVDRSKHIQEDAYERLKRILLSHKKIIDENNTVFTTAIGTSALRDADNRKEIIQRVKDDCGFEIELLSGSDESRWSYRGALFGLHNLYGVIGALDIGGGSTELSFGHNGKYEHGKSLNIGAVRITERFLSKKNSESIKSARDYIRSEINNGFDANLTIDKLIGVAGTPTALAAMKLGLQTFDAKKVNGTILSAYELQHMSEEIFSISCEELIKKFPAVHPSRSDILPAGTMILFEIMNFLQIDEVQVSTYGLRYGIMIREFEQKFHAESDEWIIQV